MDKLSASKHLSVEKLLEYATTVEVTDAKTFLKTLSDDETIDTTQKVKLIKSIVEALGENCFLRKKRYIKRRYRHAVNVTDNSTSSDEEFDCPKYTRPYRKYKARKCFKTKKTCVAKNSGATDDPFKYLDDTQNSEVTLTKCTRVVDVRARKASVQNLVPRKELSESAEHFLDRYVEAYIKSINYMTTVPVDYMNLQPTYGSLKIMPHAHSNTYVRKDSSGKAPTQNEIPSSPRVVRVLKPVTPDMRATPSTSTHLTDLDEPTPEQEPFWKRLHRYRHATQCRDEETS